MMSQIHWLSKMLHRQLLFIINLRLEIDLIFARAFGSLIPYYASNSKTLQVINYSFSSFKLSTPSKARTESSLSVGMSFDAPQVLQKTLT